MAITDMYFNLLLLTFPLFVSPQATCFNKKVDEIGGFKDIKISMSLSDIKSSHNLIEEILFYDAGQNDCSSEGGLMRDVLSDIALMKNKFKRYFIKNSSEYTLFNSPTSCITLYFFQEELMIVDINTSSGIVDNYAKVLNSENCVIQSYSRDPQREMLVSGKNVTLHCLEYTKSMGAYNIPQESYVLLYSPLKISKLLNSQKLRNENDY